jgi:hypothetical protein
MASPDPYTGRAQPTGSARQQRKVRLPFADDCGQHPLIKLINAGTQLQEQRENDEADQPYGTGGQPLPPVTGPDLKPLQV